MSCGLSREEVQAYHRDGMCAVVDGLCKNHRLDGPGICNMSLGAHPRQTQGKSFHSSNRMIQFIIFFFRIFILFALIFSLGILFLQQYEKNLVSA